LASRTIRWPRCHSTNRYGPEPNGFAAKASMPSFSYARGKMWSRVTLNSSAGNGVFVVISTVYGSTTRAPSVGPR
jgi:hypothetical protein